MPQGGRRAGRVQQLLSSPSDTANKRTIESSYVFPLSFPPPGHWPGFTVLGRVDPGNLPLPRSLFLVLITLSELSVQSVLYVFQTLSVGRII